MPAPRHGTHDRSDASRRSRTRLLPSPGIELPDQILEPLAFQFENTLTQRRHPVVPAARIVELGAGRSPDSTMRPCWMSRFSEPYRVAGHRRTWPLVRSRTSCIIP